MFIYDLVNVQKVVNFVGFLPKNDCLRSTVFVRAFSNQESVDIVGGNSRDVSGTMRLRTVVENIWSKDRAIYISDRFECGVGVRPNSLSRFSKANYQPQQS